MMTAIPRVDRCTKLHRCTSLTRITSFLAALPISSFVEVDATVSGWEAVESRMILRLLTDAASAEKKDDAKR